MTLQELVSQRRNELELQQQVYFEQSKALFLQQLIELLGLDLVESMNLKITSQYQHLNDVSSDNVQATFILNTTKFLIQLETKYFNICRWNGASDITHAETWKLTDDIRSKLISYLANIKPFHNNEV